MSTILVVDTPAILRETTVLALERQGFEPSCASNGREALDMISDNVPDLILLELQLPAMNGLEFLAALRARSEWRSIPVILMTTVRSRDEILRAAKLGIQGCLLKSAMSLSDLLDRIKEQILDDNSEQRDNEQPGEKANRGAEGDQEDHSETQGSHPIDAKATAIEALKSIKPIMSRSQITEHIEAASELKALSPTVGRLLTMTSSAECAIDQVAKVVKQDHAIALKVLKLANSVVYTRGESIDTVQKAVMRLGLSQLRQLAMNISVVDRFNANGLGEKFNSQLFWEHSIATGLIASAIVRFRDGNDNEAESAFTAGLLHDVGRMVYAEQFADTYSTVLETAARLRLPLELVESRMLLINHADAMDKLLHAWKFAKHLINPIALHHLSMANVRGLAPKMITEVATLALANRLAHAMLLGSSGNQAIYSLESFVEALKLKPDQIREIELTIPDQVDDVKFAMLNASDDQSWPDLRQEVRDQFKEPFRPIFVGLEPQTNAYRMFTDSLCDPDESAPRNVIIVHIRSNRVREAVSTQVEKIDKQPDIASLPLIVISPSGTLTLTERLISNQRVEYLSVPTSIGRFVDAVNNVTVTDKAKDNAA